VVAVTRIERVTRGL